ncbi:chromosomal replication initiator DnaA [uncultured Sulfitobacter sp.]|jgi:chromosomal replication initiation ATPase DnaA|uniref:chromosomal replication initiator DnaA n=1 Tax=Sulfitobacter sp. SH22 TaxID=3421172 RepID=UPI0025F12CE8|nr:chromosomal replication initiator DnaA [uncultured Sulfitobacter sp.]
MAQQLGLALPSRTALGRDDFFVAPSNAIAAAMIDGWQGWAGRKLALTGPAGSGKTHLTHVWAAMAGAQIINAADLATADIPQLAQTSVAVEDVPAIAGNAAAETALFHLHNLVLAEGHSLLMTGPPPVAGWNLSLPDLTSRLGAAGAAALDAPDDMLLTAVMAKLLADRQLTPKPDLIPYLLLRMDRSFAAAGALVAALDAASLAQKKPLTRALAAQVLDNRA